MPQATKTRRGHSTETNIWDSPTTHRLQPIGDGSYIPGNCRARFDGTSRTVVVIRRHSGHGRWDEEMVSISKEWRDIDGTGVQIRRSDDLDSVDVRKRRRRP